MAQIQILRSTALRRELPLKTSLQFFVRALTSRKPNRSSIIRRLPDASAIYQDDDHGQEVDRGDARRE